MLTRSFKAKKYTNARVLWEINPTPDFLGKTVFTIKERRYIVRMADICSKSLSHVD